MFPIRRSLLSFRSIRHSSHGPSYNAPTGKLFGETAPLPGQTRVKEEWEDIYYYGLGGGMALAAVLLYYKPDSSLEGWAVKEAAARLEAKGETVSPFLARNKGSSMLITPSASKYSQHIPSRRPLERSNES